MANLVQQHYLHSSKWTFFNYASSNVAAIQPKMPKRVSKSISDLNNYLQNALNRERQFYADFNVGSAKEWEQRYLIGGTSESSKILEIINSPNMISILSTGNQGFSSIKSEFLKAIQKISTDELPQIIIDELSNKITNSISNNMLDLFKELGLTGANIRQTADKSLSNLQIQQILFKSIGGKLPKRTLGRGNSSASIKNLEKLLTKNQGDIYKRKNMALNYFKTELTKYGFSIDKINTLYTAFDKVLTENLMKGNENRLLSTNEFHVTGEVSEIGEVIAYIDFNDPFDNTKTGIQSIKSMVTQAGRETVKRANISGVKSKVDTIWTSPKGNKYFIQNKNSKADIYKPFLMSGDITQLTSYPSYLPLQSDVSLNHLLENFSQYNILSDEDADLLLYLLINYNVLNKYSSLYKGHNNKGTPPAEMTKAAIDRIFSMGIQYFMSDISPVTSPTNLQSAITVSNDFIIFMDRFLIPKSLIIRNLINYYKDFNNQLMILQTTSSLSGFSQSALDEMEIKKQNARSSEGPNVVYDYHNAEMVAAGSEGGNLAAQGIKIKRINLKFNLKNLIEYELI